MAKITAISSLGWAHYSLHTALTMMASRGVTHIEIASYNDYCTHFESGRVNLAELRRLLSKYALTPIALNWSPGLPYPWEDEECHLWVKRFKRKIKKAASIGILMMTMHLGKRNTQSDRDTQLRVAAQMYEAVLRHFDILEHSHIGASIESSHWGICRDDLDSYLNALGNRLWHIHLRDSNGPDTADGRQNLELTPGEGSVNFRVFGNALDSVRYQGDVTVECEYRALTLKSITRAFDSGLTHLVNESWTLPGGVKH